jgi:hypothetical protein
MYGLEWSPGAAEDLFCRVRRQRVADKLNDVAKTALDIHTGPDGGTAPPLYWRRGLTPERRAHLDAPGHDQTCDRCNDRVEQAWHYVIVYKGLGAGRRGYHIIGIRRYTELGAALLDLGAQPTRARTTIP